MRALLYRTDGLIKELEIPYGTVAIDYWQNGKVSVCRRANDPPSNGIAHFVQDGLTGEHFEGRSIVAKQQGNHSYATEMEAISNIVKQPWFLDLKPGITIHDTDGNGNTYPPIFNPTAFLASPVKVVIYAPKAAENWYAPNSYPPVSTTTASNKPLYGYGYAEGPGDSEDSNEAVVAAPAAPVLKDPEIIGERKPRMIDFKKEDDGQE
jgi:hypothetical protein